MDYGYADKVIRTLNRKFLILFTGLKKRFDELNIMTAVYDTFDNAAEAARAAFLGLARHYYHLAAPGRKNAITEDWLDAYLLMTDPVLMYQFLPEARRKAGRLAEKLTVSKKPKSDIDKGLRDMVFQTGQFAISVADAATVKGWKDDGVKRVRWVTAGDEKVCDVCGPRDGKVYPIDKVPPKPHPNCRCTLAAVKEV